MLKVSVIIPVRNVESYLPRCLDSVLNQTLRDIEVVCVDDGSTDGSPDILASYAKRDPRIVVLAQPCSGAGAARNLGLSRARGQYVDFVDSDDFLMPDTLERRFACAEETQADIVISGFCRYDASGSVLQRRTVLGWAVSTLPRVFSPAALADSIFTTFYPAPWNKFFRADFVFRNRLQFQELPRCNDVCFTQTALAIASRLTVLDESGYGYREGRPGSAQNSTAQDPTCVCRAYYALRENLEKAGVYPSFRKSFCRAVFSSCVMTLGLLDNPKDAENFYHALHSRPFSDLFSDRLSVSDFNTDVIDYKRYCVFCTDASLTAFLIAENEWLHVLLKRGDNRLFVRTKEVVERNQLITAKDARIDDLERRIKLRTKEVVERNQLITAKDARIDDLERRIKLRTKEVVERNQLITAKDALIDGYIRQLADLRNSWAYRIGRMLTWPARKLRDMLCGRKTPGSARH